MNRDIRPMNVFDTNRNLEYFSRKIFHHEEEIRMAAHILRTLITVVSLVLTMVVLIATPGEVRGQALYQYIDKDGTVVLTDNPPPGVKAKRMESLPEATGEQTSDPEKVVDVKTEKNREIDMKRKDNRETIEALREEVEKAQSTADNYRSNMNQARGFAQKSHWRKLLDEQEKDIEEKKKKIEELESRR
jgi:predicted ribosome quality control (RQC) complex YloA/Tae2 family protein